MFRFDVKSIDKETNQMNLSDITIGRRIFMGLKSDPGGGKTIQAASFAMGGETYFFDCDNRMAPILLFHGRQKYARNINFDTYHRNYPKFASKIEDLCRSNPYHCVVVDSLTALVDMIILQSIMTAGVGTGYDKDRQSRIIGGVKLASIEDYAMEDGALMQIFDALRGLKSHVVLCAHVVETRFKDLKSKKETVTRSLLTGGKKPAAKLPVYFDEFYHLYARPDITGNMEYLAATTNTGDDWGKTALPVPPEIDLTQDRNIINTDKFLYPQVMHYIEEYKTMFPENVEPIATEEQKIY
jgi:hypothetical protein